MSILHFQKQPFKQIIWNIFCTISVLLWTITILNFYRGLKNLYTMDNFNFTNFLVDIMKGCSTKGTVIAAFAKRFQATTFRKSYCLKNFSFAHFLLIEGYWKYYLRKESVIASFVERFKEATLRKSSKWIFLVLTAACLNLSALLTFWW